MTQQLIEIKLKAYDTRLLDQSVKQILDVVQQTGAEVKGPIPLPRSAKRVIVNRSPHVNKKSREQFEIRTSKRVLLVRPAEKTVDLLKTLVLSSGIKVDIKILGSI